MRKTELLYSRARPRITHTVVGSMAPGERSRAVEEKDWIKRRKLRWRGVLGMNGIALPITVRLVAKWSPRAQVPQQSQHVGSRGDPL